ncbi:MAG: pyridoxamine 5'-phosphate oxidase family protein [Solirubrobacteraceae bacterium]
MTSNTSHKSTDRKSPAEVGTDLPEEPTSEILVLPREECVRLLAAHNFGRLAVAMDSPVIRPVNYVFDEPSQSVAFQTADGSKFHAMLVNGNAAFEIDGIDPGSRTGWSVIIVGMTEEVTSPGELRRLDRLGLETWTPGRKAHWMRIRAWTVTGRRIVPSGGIGPAQA